MKWKGKVPQLTREQAERIAEVARIKRALPTWQDIANELNVPQSVVRHYAWRMPKRYA